MTSLLTIVEDLARTSAAEDPWRDLMGRTEEVGAAVAEALKALLQGTEGPDSEHSYEEIVGLAAGLMLKFRVHAEPVWSSRALEQHMEKVELQSLLSGKHDHRHCFFTIQAGAGGTEANDWAEMIDRMYLYFFERREWKVEAASPPPALQTKNTSRCTRLSPLCPRFSLLLRTLHPTTLPSSVITGPPPLCPPAIIPLNLIHCPSTSSIFPA